MDKIRESNGLHYYAPGKFEPIYCPANAWDCPYYDEGICYIYNPMEECDDFAAFFNSWEEWESL